MSTTLRIVIVALMSLALLFGFLHHSVPASATLNFERLHIFLFNLCSGGTILLYYTENRERPSGRVLGFLALSLLYALLAFFELYPPAILLALALSGIVERVRVSKFSLFPRNFFEPATPVHQKFHQASLLCLSMGLAISAMVILNNRYLHLESYEKLTLDTFFLGFSFPLSLITMSVMFSLIRDDRKRTTRVLKNVGFWTVNLGVITFFGFILLEKLYSQLAVSTVLFCAVIMIFCLFVKEGAAPQQRNFLISGMVFLLFTAVSGILYIFLEFTPGYDKDTSALLLRMHSFASLYGWNLSGFAVICRYHDFPIKLHSRKLVMCHWVTVILLAPFGNYYAPFAIAATISYTAIVCVIFFTRRRVTA